jgi:hypothetical protein
VKKTKKETVEIQIPSKAIRVQNASCANGHSLMDHEHKINGYPSITVLIKHNSTEGLIHLDPIYGSYKNLAEIKVPKDSVVEFFCPLCKASLTDEAQTCNVCSAPMFALHLPFGGIIEGCLRNGCQFHSLKFVNGEELVKRLYDDHTLEAYL